MNRRQLPQARWIEPQSGSTVVGEEYMAYLTLLYATRNAIGYIKINRPEKLNALNHQVMEELFNCFQALQKDEGVRVVILTGSGEKAFVAGADINELALQTPVEGKDFSQFGQQVFNLIENLGKPVIAAINGFALGGGCELAMACTLRVAADTARLGQPEVKLGIIPGYGGSQRLPRLVGKGRALELILAGEPVTAAEAHRLGLVNQVVPAAELPAAAENLAHKIIANAPLAIRFALEAVNHGMEMTAAEGQFLEATLFGLCCTTADMKEGTQAFLQKRPAKFAGK
jgi:enoyl-CoA hydratase/carnithine racemase